MFSVLSSVAQNATTAAHLPAEHHHTLAGAQKRVQSRLFGIEIKSTDWMSQAITRPALRFTLQQTAQSIKPKCIPFKTKCPKGFPLHCHWTPFLVVTMGPRGLGLELD
jgi:hypothetical protein